MVMFSGAVLAGGRSRRMGRDKAFVEVDGIPMIERVAAALEEAGAAEIRITGGDQDRLEALGLIVDPDAEPYAGPLAALIASLEHAHHDTVFVLACDLPRVSAGAIGSILDALGEDDAAVPTDAERRQWLHGVWRRRCLPTLRAAYEAGERAIHRAAEDLDVRIVAGVAPAVLADADSPGDLAGSPYPAPMHIAEIDIDELTSQGRDATNVAGGTLGWIKAGHAVDRGAGSY
jgi:molybdopterin-guanine dinucleotide biosynthesis protein A